MDFRLPPDDWRDSATEDLRPQVEPGREDINRDKVAPLPTDRSRDGLGRDRHESRARGGTRKGSAFRRTNCRRAIESSARRPKRSTQVERLIGLRIRPEERQLLQEIGKFRVINTRDLAEFLYVSNDSQLSADLKFLQANRLVEVHALNARRDNPLGQVQKFEAVTLTAAGRELLIETGDIGPDQKVYSGLVKSREAEHDTQIYRAYRKELERLAAKGASNVRVRLDFELKQQFNRGAFVAQKSQPDRDESAIKHEVAQQLDLRVVSEKVVVPDLRIEYDMPDGASAHVDVEVATAAYRKGSLAAKAQAGFRLYASSHDIGRLGAAVQDDHDIMSEIMSL